MIKNRVFLFLCLCVFTLSVNAQTRKHNVVGQETVYGISKQYGVSIEKLQRLNPDLKDGLKEGMILIIPDANPEGLLSHMVKEGETLYSLAQEYKTSPEEIIKANAGLKEGLKAGVEIFIPSAKESVSANTDENDPNFYYHTVKPGETAYSLSKKFKISLDSIYLLNPNVKQGLQIGIKLKLPKNREEYAKKSASPKAGLVSDEGNKQNQIEEKKAGEEHFLYQVKVGDSFFSLKKEFGVSKEELIALNPELLDGIELDKYIIIPREGQGAKTEEKNTGWLDRLFNKVDSTGTAASPIILIPKDSTSTKSEELNANTKKDIERSYRISLMLPFTIPSDSVRNMTLEAYEETRGNLDPNLVDYQKYNKPKLSRNSVASIEFYQGLRLAMDSLSKLGMPLEVNVFDTRNDKNLVKSFIDSLKTNKPDLVIGPLFKSNVEFVADELREEEIMVLSPLSRTVSPESRPNLIQCIPGENAAAAKMADIINDDFSNSNIIFAHTGTSKESRSILNIKARLLARDDASYMGDLTFTSEMLKRNELAEVISSNKRNVFVVVSEDKVFLSDLINKLRQLRDTSIYILASHKVKDINTLESEYLNKLKLTMTDPNFINYQDSTVINFINSYRKTFKTEPSTYAFQGYDIGILFLNMLWENAALLEGVLAIDTVYQGLQTRFQFSKAEYSGYQNEFLFHTGIRGMSLIRLGNEGRKKAPAIKPETEEE